MRDYEQEARLQSAVNYAAGQRSVIAETLHSRLGKIEGQLNTLAQGISCVADRVVGGSENKPCAPVEPPADSLEEQIVRVHRALTEAEAAFARLTPVL